MTQEEFRSDLNVPVELIGMPAFMSPMLHKISTQRAAMFSAHAAQAMVVDGAEYPRISTGMEPKVGKYDFNPSDRDQDMQIKEIIPKFKSNIGKGVINNPFITVIYQGGDDGKIGYIDIPSYTELGSGFGYINKKLNRHLLVKHNFIEKDVKFISAPNHMDELYNLGVNANVCYIPDWGVADDAFVISKSLQKKLSHTVINTITLVLHIDDIPLNLYGDENEYKIFPDIGETVRDDGCVVALRTHNTSSLLTDITTESLRTLEPLHDNMHVAPPGAEIIDVQVFTNQKRYPALLKNELYTQPMLYQQQHIAYYETIVDLYEQYRKEGYKFSTEFTNLVTRCSMLCYTREGRQLNLMNKKNPVDYIHLKITWAMHRTVDKGFKISDRCGAKGVISDIRDDEDMPVTEDGVRADIEISGESPFNRLNDGQYTESFLNYANDVMHKRVLESTAPVQETYEYILKYVDIIRPVYAKFVREMTSHNPQEFVEAVKKDGLYLVIPPYCQSMTPETILRVSREMNIERQTIRYASYDEDGNRVVHTLEDKGIIGSKYLYLLGKIPIDSVNCVEYGYTSQFNLPIRPGSKAIKTQSLIGSTPCRYGEDETMILCLSTDSSAVKRMYGIYATSPVARNEMQYQLLTADKPTDIDHIPVSTEQIIDSDVSIALLKHQLAVCGYEIVEEE